MDKTKHTPGPWYVREDREFYQYHAQPICIANYKDEDGYDDGLDVWWICRLFDSWDKEAYANARLIAAAPDLLAACELSAYAEAEAGYGPGTPEQSTLSKECLTAIAKAKGE